MIENKKQVCPIHGITEFRLYRHKKDNTQYLKCILCNREVLNNKYNDRIETKYIIMRNCKKHGYTEFRRQKSKNTISGFCYRCIQCKREKDNLRNKLHREKMKLP